MSRRTTINFGEGWPMAKQFIGLSRLEAKKLAETHGLQIRDKTQDADFFFSDLRSSRVNLWFNESDIVEHADIY